MFRRHTFLFRKKYMILRKKIVFFTQIMPNAFGNLVSETLFFIYHSLLYDGVGIMLVLRNCVDFDQI